MNTVLKKIIFVIVFILATLILPGVLLLMFVDATQGFSVFVTEKQRSSWRQTSAISGLPTPTYT